MTRTTKLNRRRDCCNTTKMSNYGVKVKRKVHNSGSMKKWKGLRTAQRGRVAEAEVARMFRDHGFNASRTGHLASSTRELRCQFADVTVQGLEYWIEVKRVSKANDGRIREWIKKAEAQAMDNDLSMMLCFREHRNDWKVVIDLQDLLAILAKAEGTDVTNMVTEADIAERIRLNINASKRKKRTPRPTVNGPPRRKQEICE